MIAIDCPHPAAADRHSMTLDGGCGPMRICLACFRELGALVAGWHQRSIGPREVVARMRALGYTRVDAARFLFQLICDRLRVRVGFAKVEDLIGGG